MKDIDHAIVILFNVYRGPVPGGLYLNGTHGLDGLPKKSYIEKRFPILCDLTMRSLVNQISKNFFVVLMYEHRSDFGPLLDRFRQEARIHLPFRVEFAPIPPIDFTTAYGYRHNFWKRRITEEQAVRRACEGRKWLYVTYLDGDDLLRDDYVLKMQTTRCADDVKALVCMNGYAFLDHENRLKNFTRGTAPPFFTLRYLEQDFLAGARHDGGPGRHLHVPEFLKSVKLPHRLFAQTVHEGNDSTTFSAKGVSEEIVGVERSALLARLGRPEFQSLPVPHGSEFVPLQTVPRHRRFRRSPYRRTVFS